MKNYNEKENSKQIDTNGNNSENWIKQKGKQFMSRLLEIIEIYYWYISLLEFVN